MLRLNLHEVRGKESERADYWSRPCGHPTRFDYKFRSYYPSRVDPCRFTIVRVTVPLLANTKIISMVVISSGYGKICISRLPFALGSVSILLQYKPTAISAITIFKASYTRLYRGVRGAVAINCTSATYSYMRRGKNSFSFRSSLIIRFFERLNLSLRFLVMIS